MHRTTTPIAIVPLAEPGPSPGRPAGRLQRLGNAMQRHGARIRAVQWAVVAIYLVLVTVPAFLPLPGDEARILDNLTLFAQFLFWGVWWPFVLLSMVLVGRAWCGVFCPEGALSEAASSRGLGRPIPRWVRWPGWPCVAFVSTTVYGQLVSVYQYAQAALLVLGGSTLAAVAVGWLWGRSRRVWCRYLCPVNGVFNLLARLAPVHFRVDRAHWDARRDGHSAMPHCAPLLDIRRMRGGAACHMCGRCSGHREAVALARRSTTDEIARHGREAARPWDSALLLFGLIGVAMGAFHWTASPWYVALRVMALDAVVEHDWLFLLADNAPWWVLTNYPQNQDVFTWLDGTLIVTYILGTGAVGGAALHALCRLAARALGASSNPHHLALSYVPLGGCGVFLGLSMTTLTMLRHEGWRPDGVAATRAALLGACWLWSLWLAWRSTQAYPSPLGRRGLAMLPLAAGGALIVAGWLLLFYVW